VVLVWNHLSHGDADYCAALAAINAILTVLLYSPYAVLFVSVLPKLAGVQGELVSIHLLQISECVLTYMGVPLCAASIIAFLLQRFKGASFYRDVYLPAIGPLTLYALLFTVTIIFSSNSHTLVRQLPLVLFAAFPMLIYFCSMFSLVFLISYILELEYSKACAIAFTAASNNLEIAMAVSISSFGVHSDESLMCVVAALIEIPTMLVLVQVAKHVETRWPHKKRLPP